MKKIKNKFILLVIIGIVLLLGLQIYWSYEDSQIDRNSYLVVMEGTAKIDTMTVSPGTRYKLENDMTVTTLGDESLAVVEWGDGSVTRLGGETSVHIRTTNIAKNLSRIQISFTLFSGKTWSNVTSFIGDDSYFHESFQDNEASVRGTVFNVNLDDGYLYVVDHDISLVTSEGKEIFISENAPFSLQAFSFIQLTEFLKTYTDSAWFSENKDFDTQLLQALQDNLLASLSSSTLSKSMSTWFGDSDQIVSLIQKGASMDEVQSLLAALDQDEKQVSYDALLEIFQQYNTVGSENTQLFARKVAYRDALLLLSDTETERQSLLRNTLYDVQDVIDAKQYEQLTQLFGTLSQYTDELSSMDASYFRDLALQNLPSGLQNLLDSFGGLKDVVTEKVGKIELDINLNEVGQDLGNLRGTMQEAVNEKLDSVYQKFLQ